MTPFEKTLLVLFTLFYIFMASLHPLVEVRKQVYTYACGVGGYEYHQINGWTLESYKILVETIPEWVSYQIDELRWDK